MSKCWLFLNKDSLSSFLLNVHIFHLGWGWTGDDCFPHTSILCHMLLHSQQVYIFHHTLTPLFPRPSDGYCPPTLAYPYSPTHPSFLFTCPNISVSLFCLNFTEFRSSNPHISATSLLDFCLSTLLLPCISASCIHICVKCPSVCLSMTMFFDHSVIKK